MDAYTVGNELAKLAISLEETHGAGFDRYFGAFVHAGQFVEEIRQDAGGVRVEFDAAVERLLADRG